jgi:hypothetical protein
MKAKTGKNGSFTVTIRGRLSGLPPWWPWWITLVIVVAAVGHGQLPAHPNLY